MLLLFYRFFIFKILFIILSSFILISFLISGLWSRYIAATASERAEAAAIYDLLLMLASSGIYQIWAIQRNSFSLLVVGDLAAAAGTYPSLLFGFMKACPAPS